MYYLITIIGYKHSSWSVLFDSVLSILVIKIQNYKFL